MFGLASRLRFHPIFSLIFFKNTDQKEQINVPEWIVESPNGNWTSLKTNLVFSEFKLGKQDWVGVLTVLFSKKWTLS